MKFYIYVSELFYFDNVFGRDGWNLFFLFSFGYMDIGSIIVKSFKDLNF